MFAPVHSAWATIKGNNTLHVSWCVTGIFGCLVAYGMLQERIMAEPFAPDGALFKESLFLVLCNRTVTTVVALVALLSMNLEVKPVAPIYSYFAISFSNVVATTCQYEALKYLSFPMQTLGKSAKMIPVMIWGGFILRNKYGVKDYLVGAMVMAGCSLFLLTGEIKSKKADDSSSNMMMGLMLMLGYLGFDGFTSNFQARLFKGFNMTIFNQVFYVQLTAVAQSLFGLITSGHLWSALDFVTTHPAALKSIFLLSLTATMGQLFIYHTIKAYGPLLFATVMTTRQFMSILLSCILFVHPLSLGQWAGTALVFGALYFKTFSKKKKESGAEVKAEPELADEEKQPLTTEAASDK
ncbi:hypothetical protein BSKO_03535 [Bryopsis sp. KO-2023]|nr:hypothetical protein BSKO_03535 [Bryopsis sp. KO-2023]